MAGHAVVPKFGSWDAENIGYTVFFEKVRDNKGAPAPPAAAAPKEHYEKLSRNVPSRPPSSHGQPAAVPKAPGGYDFDPYEHYENLSRNVPSRPPSSHGSGHGHAPAPQHRGGSNGYHRRTGSNGSNAASEVSSRGSKFSPPKPYQPRYSSNNYYYHHQAQQGAGAGAAYAHAQYHHHGAPAAQRAASASPSPPCHHVPPPRSPKASAVPRFGVWDEQNAAMAAQGFTVQFEKVKRHREEARTAAAPPVPPQLSSDRHAAAPERRYRQRKSKKSFLSKLYRCMFPVVRE
ncbi:protein transport protein SEC9-like [Phragmites australis]|uniref:protein transport protein SEC9-like n=1 Tax=Phragmites australis TaxID=29695 RepID=UPI002D77748D|nr:protein transport protein SEC9-like [Phragmites australis]XP_062218423.1 protein transport protein SEC9-like [Phragmites australis]XP_062218424.1 protein transport protein SEC9-like [Phragmites australis]XP_062218425.1 protein transport protein SEC9-like [Phragmites australis]XP_062218426.1 protein transport protein SEC9-like [Phragmites australis]XP_062218427.1 protein transport protein SEC9-like [Phragmites australis]XP_062218428.1 protein transport protein SEC9-like [Phragmites australi